MQERRTTIDPQGKHGMEHLLGINSAQINPDYVNLSTVQPVVDMSMQGYARINDLPNILTKTVVRTLAADAANAIEWVISYGNPNNATLDDMVYRIGYNLRVIAFGYLIYIPYQLLTGVNLVGRTVRFVLNLSYAGMSAPVWQSTHQIYSAPNSTRYSKYFIYPGDWAIAQELDPLAPFEPIVSRYTWGSANRVQLPVIPAGASLKYALFPNCMPAPDTGYFDLPAGTVLTFYIIAQQVPIGAPLPAYY